MKKDVKKKNNEMSLKHETLKGTFIDYRGMSRDFVMVAVSIPVKTEMCVVIPNEDTQYNVDLEDECREVYTYELNTNNLSQVENIEPITTQASTMQYYGTCAKIVSPVRKMLSIGVSVRCVRDKDTGRGEEIAYGKAVNNVNKGDAHVLFVSHTGMVNTTMVKALLDQEAEHFAKDPGSYIKGYNAARDRYIKTGVIAQKEMTQEEYEQFQKGTLTPVKPEPVRTPIEYNKASVLNETPVRTEPKTEPVETSGLNTFGSATLNETKADPVEHKESEVPDEGKSAENYHYKRLGLLKPNK